VHRLLAVAVAVLIVAGLGSAAAVGGHQAGSGGPPVASPTAPANQAPVDPAGAVVPAPVVVPTTVVPPPPPKPRPTGPVALAGCPPPPPAPSNGSGNAWRPSVLVPEAALPAPAPPATRVAPLKVLTGKGMWLWKYRLTENGDPDAIVTKAVAAGLNQLWVRVGDSQDAFYGASVLEELVPRAHRNGLSVIGWGFPYLYDPVADAQWSSAALHWRSGEGDSLDGFSPDLETASEGTVVTERRLQVYLGEVNKSAGTRPLVATVYRPTDRLWTTYPYRAVAPYVDGFAAMVYWGCTEPGFAAAQAIERLAALRPVHLIGQGYNMADEGGRRVAPSADETWRFLDIAHGGGALGASFWVWQEINEEQWTTMAEYTWPRV
jgi:hypothetical protein